MHSFALKNPLTDTGILHTAAFGLQFLSNISIKKRGGLMFSALDSGASAPGLSPGREYCIVFLGETLYSHSAYGVSVSNG